MNGRTHEAVGVASVMVAMHGASTKEVIVGCLIASAAAVIPDVDLIDNRKGMGAQMLIEVVKQSLIPIGIGMYYGASKYLIMAWLAVMVLFVAQPHRGFSHSILAMLGTSYLFGAMTTERLIEPYAIAYASHLIADVLNTKKVSIFYPAGVCAGWCKSGGKADWFIGAVASLMIVVMIGAMAQNIDIVEMAIREVIR